ncbi:MAG: flagellar biosynthetic protein FliO [Oscillospiraceae bacterium]
MAFAFLAMCLIIYLSYVVSRRLAQGASAMGVSKYMRIVDRIPLGKDRYLLIVTIGEKVFFLGVCDQGVTTLSPLEATDLIEQEKAAMPTSQSIENFKQLLQKKMKHHDDE